MIVRERRNKHAIDGSGLCLSELDKNKTIKTRYAMVSPKKHSEKLK